MVVLEQDSRGRFRAPAGEAGKAVGRVADEREPVRDRGGPDAPLVDHGFLVVRDPAASIEQDDVRVVHELGHVLVGRADEDLLDVEVRGEAAAGRRDRIVGLEFDHRPDDEAERPNRVLRDRELRQQLTRHPGRRLVAGEQVVPEGLDDVIGRAADVRRALLAEEVEQLVDDAGHAGQVHAVAAERRRPRGVVRPEQLVGRVDQVEPHSPGRSTPRRRRVGPLAVGLASARR